MRRAPSLALLLLVACPRGGEEHREEHHDHAGERKSAGTPGEVHVSPAAVRRAEIRIEKVQRMALASAAKVPAQITLDPDQLVHLQSLVRAQVAEVRTSVGARVEKGEVLAVLKSVELAETRAGLMRARANLEVAQANYERHEKLLAEDIGSERGLLEAKAELRRAKAEVAAARSALQVYGAGGSGSATPLKSPIEGEVVQRHASIGEVVDPDRVLFVVADTNPVWATGQAYPQDIAGLKEGAAATLTISDLPGRSWQAPVSWVSPVLDERTRTLPLRVVLDNEDGVLRPGLFGTLHVDRGDKDAVPTVARSGVVEVEGRSAVFLPGDEEGAFRLAPITTGQTSGARVEVIDGLEDGQRYVARGSFVLKSELLRAQLGDGHAH